MIKMLPYTFISSWIIQWWPSCVGSYLCCQSKDTLTVFDRWGDASYHGALHFHWEEAPSHSFQTIIFFLSLILTPTNMTESCDFLSLLEEAVIKISRRWPYKRVVLSHTFITPLLPYLMQIQVVRFEMEWLYLPVHSNTCPAPYLKTFNFVRYSKLTKAANYHFQQSPK